MHLIGANVIKKDHNIEEFKTSTKLHLLTPIYLASTTVTVNSLVVELEASFLLEIESSLSESISMQYIGCFGCINFEALSQFSIEITSDMIGLSSGCCCKHKRLTWMHLNTSDRVYDSPIEGSINSNGLPSFHNFHA